MGPLTRAEEQVMRALWSIGKGFVKDVMEALPTAPSRSLRRSKGPKRGATPPAYTTVSTIIRILEEKGYVGHEAFGRAHRYHPKVSRERYEGRAVERLVRDWFGGSARSLLSHFIERNDLSMEELDELLKLIERRKKG